MVGPRITVIRIIYPRPLALCNYSRWFSPSYKLWGTRARGYRVGTAERRTKPTPRLTRRPAPGCNPCKPWQTTTERTISCTNCSTKTPESGTSGAHAECSQTLTDTPSFSATVGRVGSKTLNYPTDFWVWVGVYKQTATNESMFMTSAYETRRQPALIGHPNTSRNDVIICHKHISPLKHTDFRSQGS
jgi:hypothetical protein